ncbi:MAG TPA: hypothetical protein ENI33_04155 [Thermoplasmatales archaeon]|nr:hypothetical protein [Thermoplasmatales archaeon]
MVAITVVLAATIYVWVSGFGGGGSKAMSMAITQTATVSGTSATFRVDSVSQGAKWSDIDYITTDNTTYRSPTNTDDGDGIIEAGETFTVTDAEVGDTLTLRDKTSNSIILTKTFW